MNVKNFFLSLKTISLPAPPVVLCIGSSKIISDCYGPTVGHILGEKYPLNAFVYGSLLRPVNALNLVQTIQTIRHEHPKSKIIAVDSFISPSAYDQIKLLDCAIKPGLASGKALPEVGDLSIIASPARMGANSYCMGKVFALAEITAKLLHLAIGKHSALENPA